VASLRMPWRGLVAKGDGACAAALSPTAEDSRRTASRSQGKNTTSMSLTLQSRFHTRQSTDTGLNTGQTQPGAVATLITPRPWDFWLSRRKLVACFNVLIVMTHEAGKSCPFAISPDHYSADGPPNRSSTRFPYDHLRPHICCEIREFDLRLAFVRTGRWRWASSRSSIAPRAPLAKSLRRATESVSISAGVPGSSDSCSINGSSGALWKILLWRSTAL